MSNPAKNNTQQKKSKRQRLVGCFASRVWYVIGFLLIAIAICGKLGLLGISSEGEDNPFQPVSTQDMRITPTPIYLEEFPDFNFYCWDNYQIEIAENTDNRGETWTCSNEEMSWEISVDAVCKEQHGQNFQAFFRDNQARWDCIAINQ